MRIEKADTYWNAAAIKIKAIESPSMVKDAQANFNNFQTGGIDIANVNTTELIKQSQNSKLKIEAFPTGCVNYIELNTRAGHVFADEKLRQAMRIGLNRNEFIHKIVGVPGYLSAFGIVPDFMPGSKANSTYRREAPLKTKDADIAGAKKLIQDALKASGKAQVASFTILANDSSRVKKFAEYYQNSLSKLFGTQVKIETVPFKSRLQRSRDGQFDIAISGWCPDYRDPMTFMDLYTSKNENNTSGWSNAQFDSLIEKAANEGDLAARVKIFAEAETLLMEQAPLVTTDQAATPYVVSKSLKGVRRAPFVADPDFRYSEWAP
jgi:oligopeptide transport system substrate-binding protein